MAEGTAYYFMSPLLYSVTVDAATFVSVQGEPKCTFFSIPYECTYFSMQWFAAFQYLNSLFKQCGLHGDVVGGLTSMKN